MTSVAIGDLLNGIEQRASIGRPHNRVWGGSRLHADVVRKSMRWDQARELWYTFRRMVGYHFDRRKPGSHGGVLTPFEESVYRYLLLDGPRDPDTDRADPALSVIARAVRSSVTAVHNALTHLKELGIITWERCCTRDGAGRLCQEENQYEFRPQDKWLHKPPPKAPHPHRSTIGAPEPVPDPLDAAGDAISEGDRWAAITALENSRYANLTRDQVRLRLAQASALRSAATAAADPTRAAAMEALDAQTEASRQRVMAAWLARKSKPKT